MVCDVQQRAMHLQDFFSVKKLQYFLVDQFLRYSKNDDNNRE